MALQLFPSTYQSTEIGFDPIGILIPLSISAAIVVILLAYRKLDLKRATLMASLVGATSITFSVIYSYSLSQYNSFAPPPNLRILTVLILIAVVIPYFRAFGRRKGALVGALELYVIGVFGTFSNDLIRIFLFGEGAGEQLTIGGGGLTDLCFFFGIFLAVSYATLVIGTRRMERPQ